MIYKKFKNFTQIKMTKNIIPALASYLLGFLLFFFGPILSPALLADTSSVSKKTIELIKLTVILN